MITRRFTMANVIGNGEERIQELEQQLEMEKQKYRIIKGTS